MLYIVFIAIVLNYSQRYFSAWDMFLCLSHWCRQVWCSTCMPGC